MATTKMLHPAGQIPKRSFIQRPFTANIDHPDTQTNDMNGEYYFFAYPNPDLSLCDF